MRFRQRDADKQTQVRRDLNSVVGTALTCPEIIHNGADEVLQLTTVVLQDAGEHVDKHLHAATGTKNAIRLLLDVVVGKCMTIRWSGGILPLA